MKVKKSSVRQKKVRRLKEEWTTEEWRVDGIHTDKNVYIIKRGDQVKTVNRQNLKRVERFRIGNVPGEIFNIMSPESTLGNADECNRVKR